MQGKSLFLNQNKHIHNLLAKVNMTIAKLSLSLMASHTQLDAFEGNNMQDYSLYHTIMDGLQYITITMQTRYASSWHIQTMFIEMLSNES